MKTVIARFITEDEGQDLIEYAIVGGLIAVAAVAAVTAIGVDLKRIYGLVTTELAKVKVQ